MQVVVGRIGRPHGVRGEVTVEPRTDEPDRHFVAGNVLLVDGGQSLTIETVKWHSGRLVVTFAGCADRTAAELLRNTILEAERADDERPEDPDEFYDYQLVGLHVVTTAGEAVGTVSEVLHLPAQDVLSVTSGDREILVPFVSAVVPLVDIEARRIVIDPPPGLLDADL
jgi:16S rRNA processing protein RimM